MENLYCSISEARFSNLPIPLLQSRVLEQRNLHHDASKESTRVHDGEIYHRRERCPDKTFKLQDKREQALEVAQSNSAKFKKALPSQETLWWWSTEVVSDVV